MDLQPRQQPTDLVILLVEDDPGDAILFEELLRPEIPGFQLHIATTIREAVADVDRLDPMVCVLDLGLPGCVDLQALEELRSHHPRVPTIVLTGLLGSDLGPDAVALGAQDYLIKGQEDGPTIARSIRFAIERRAAQRVAAELAVAEVRAKDQMRLERALVARPVLRSNRLNWSSRYVTARDGAVGGDFLDCVQIDDRHIRLVVGDVAGHGPDEAALGVTLRAGWRALVLAVPATEDVLPAMDRLLVSERQGSADFATVADLVVDLELGSLVVRCAGHPAPVVDGLGPLEDTCRTSPLGIRTPWRGSQGTRFELGTDFTITLYTDGLFERRREDGRIGSIDDVESIFAKAGDSPSVEDILAAAAQGAEPWRDDVAIGRLAVSL